MAGRSASSSSAPASVASLTQSTTDPTTATLTTAGAGSDGITVVYSRNGSTVGIDNVNFTVVSPSATGYGSAELATIGDVASVRVGQSPLVQIIVRNPATLGETSGVTELDVPSSDAALGAVAAITDSTPYYYRVTGVKAGTFIRKANVGGASAPIPTVLNSP